MQQREKYLAIGLGVVVAAYGVLTVFAPAIQAPITEREERLADAKDERDEAEIEEIQTLAAIRTLADWEKTGGLAGAPISVLRTYRNWLVDLAADAGWSNIEMDAAVRNVRAINAEATPIEVAGKATATAEQLANFLTKYEAAPILHGLSKLRITSESAAPDSPLTVEFTSSAIVLKGSKPRDWTPDTAAAPDAVWASLAQSNPFKLPADDDNENAAPRMRPLRPQSVGLGETVTASFGARDPDGDSDAITFDLVGRVEGAELVAEDRLLRFTPTAESDGKEVTITLRATDEAGQSSTMDWRLRVEPNAATTTELVGAIVRNEEPIAWLINRDNGRRVELRAGDRLEFGRISGEVEAIGRRSLTFRSGEQRYELKLGQKVADAVPLS